MRHFSCRTAGAECDARITAPSQADLMRQLSQHVTDVHKVPAPSQTILDYLASTVRDEPAGSSAQ